MPALGQDELGTAEQFPVVGDQIPRPVHAAGLLVGGGEPDDVPGQRRVAFRQLDESHQLDDRDALGVQGATPDYVAVVDPPLEGRGRPRSRVGGNNVQMGQQDDRSRLAH